MKNLQTRQFSETTELKVNVVDEMGKPIDEKTLTQDQVNFCAKLATKKYKKFSMSKYKEFDETTEDIEVVLPEDMDAVDLDEVAEQASEERDAEYADEEVVATVIDEEEEIESVETEEMTNVEEFCDSARKFAAQVRKSKRFSEEELAEVKEELAELTEVIEILEDEIVPEVIESSEEIKQFSAKLKNRKFSSEDLEEVKELQEELTNIIDSIEEVEEQEDCPVADEDAGITELKQFSAQAIDKALGDDTVSSYKSKFFASQRRR